MGEVVGDLLPLAVGVAISPVPVIAVILMLFAPRARGTSIGFLAGWTAGIVVATTIVSLLAGTAGMESSGEPSAAASWIRLLLGVALLVLGVRQWRGRSAPGEPERLPAWMAAVDGFTSVKALGLGFLLSAVNPKNLALCVAAGVAIAGGALTTGQDVAAVAVFTVVAVSTVAVPVAGYLAAADRVRGPLDATKAWLQANNTAVMSVLLIVFGVVLFGKGLGALL